MSREPVERYVMQQC